MSDRLTTLKVQFVEALDSFQNDFSKLEDALDQVNSIRELCDDLQSTIEGIITAAQVERTKEDSSYSLFDQIKKTPTEAVRSFFNENPEKPWSPKEIRTKLETLASDGYLKMKEGRKPKEFVHSILISLTRQGFIKKNQPYPKSRQSFYVKSDTESLEQL